MSSQIKKNFYTSDLFSAIAVFLVAIPLCLGIAHACGVPLISGIFAGIIGGIFIGSISDSPLSVSGPAAGLISLIIVGISELGSFNLFLLSICIAGLLQMIMGAFHLGKLTRFIPHSVIEGMMAGIGIILIIKQAHFLYGQDLTHEFQGESLTISIISLLALFFWDKVSDKRLKTIPGSIIVVVLSLLISVVYHSFFAEYEFDSSYLVHLPEISDWNSFKSNLLFPDFSGLSNWLVYKHAFVISLVASIESLLCVNGIEKLDPLGRHANKNRELLAQGFGNMISGLIGGLPVTSVIVRSSVNLSAGAKSKNSAILHGFYLLAALFLFSGIINKVPIVALASILCFTGYKLAHPKNFIQSFKKGFKEWGPFLTTLLIVVFKDLLTGVGVGLALVTIINYTEKGSLKHIKN